MQFKSRLSEWVSNRTKQLARCVRLEPAPTELTRVQVRTLNEVVYYARHGFSMEQVVRGNKYFMVRNA